MSVAICLYIYNTMQMKRLHATKLQAIELIKVRFCKRSISYLYPPRLEGAVRGKLWHFLCELILAGHSNSLRRRWCVQFEHVGVSNARSPPGFSDGALHGEEDGGGEEEWRFPHRLGGEDGPRVGGAAEETHVELGGDVAEAGDLVGAGPLRQQVPVGRVHELLHHEQSVTLCKCPFNLPDVDRRVETLPQVHDDVRLEDGVVAGEAVDLDHGAAGAVGGVVKPSPAVCLGVVVEAWGCIEARGEEGNALEVCPPHPVVPALVRHALPVRFQPVSEHCAGVEDGHA